MQPSPTRALFSIFYVVYISRRIRAAAHAFYPRHTRGFLFPARRGGFHLSKEVNFIHCMRMRTPHRGRDREKAPWHFDRRQGESLVCRNSSLPISMCIIYNMYICIHAYDKPVRSLLSAISRFCMVYRVNSFQRRVSRASTR